LLLGQTLLTKSYICYRNPQSSLANLPDFLDGKERRRRENGEIEPQRHRDTEKKIGRCKEEGVRCKEESVRCYASDSCGGAL
jgi:hypothetical protein